MRPPAAPTPVPMSAPLPAPYPVPAPIAAPLAAPTAAPVAVPQPVAASASRAAPMIDVCNRFMLAFRMASSPIRRPWSAPQQGLRSYSVNSRVDARAFARRHHLKLVPHALDVLDTRDDLRRGDPLFFGGDRSPQRDHAILGLYGDLPSLDPLVAEQRDLAFRGEPGVRDLRRGVLKHALRLGGGF